MYIKFFIAIIIFSFSSSVSLAQARPDLGGLTVEDFGELENVRSVTISPDGLKLAMLIGSKEDERSIVVQEIGKKAMRIPTGEEDALAVRFLNNDRILVIFDKFVSRFGGRAQANQTRFVFMDLNGKNQKQMSPNQYIKIAGDPKHLISTRVVSRGRLDRSGQVRSKFKFEKVKVNIKTGKITGLNAFPDNFRSPVYDPNNNVRMMMEIRSGNVATEIKEIVWHTRDNPKGKWREVFKAKRLDDAPFGVAGFLDDNTVLLVGRMLGVAGLERDKVSIYKMNLLTGDISLYRENANVDMGGVMTDPYTRYVTGYTWTEGRNTRHYIDPELSALQEQLNAAFPGKLTRMVSWSEDRSKFVISTTLAGHSLVYYLLDRNTNQVVLIARAYPKIPEAAISKVEYIKYKARDGMEIPAYLTIPVGRENEKNLPMILLPHGGPRARDTWSNELWRQSFAFMGYVVLQPQFRGSEGYGIKFRNAGDHEWGKKMQSDLSDGVRFLIDQGLVDADRVCIAGWSYGGYAAMAGGTITSELYRCVIAGAGVSDLIKVMRVFDRSEWWEESIGDFRIDGQRLRETSPITHVDKVRAPFLLIHGEEDTTVSIEQSEVFAKALKRANKHYKFIRLKNEDHNLKKGETRVLQLTEMKEFLEKHNPAYLD